MMINSYLKTNSSYSPNRIVLLILAAVPLFLHGCTSYKRHEHFSEPTGFSDSGKASYYAMKFQSRKTASGDRFDNRKLTAAHKTLPFGTKVLVTNVDNGKSVTVTINDRGPFVKGRIIDLSQAAFAKIENIAKGLAAVEIKVIN